MRRGFKLVSMLLSLCLVLPVYGGEARHSKHTMKYKGKSVQYVKVVMDETVQVDVVFDKDRIDAAANLEDLAKQKEGFAAINGTFFSAYNNQPLPYGVIIQDGKMVHKNGHPAVVGFTKDQKVMIDCITTDLVRGTSNGENDWYAWEINHPITQDQAIILFTEEYKGEIQVQPGGVAVVVKGGKVVEHTTSPTKVPAGGLVIVFNASIAGSAGNLQIGEVIDYTVSITPTYTEPEAWEDVVTAVAAGPSLIIEGNVTNQPKEERFEEAKITTQSAKRSFIGFREEKGEIILVMGTVSSATMNEMVEIAKMMGLDSAMCLDGGASSGLYYKGKNISAPGRKLNNSLVFSEKAAVTPSK